VEITFTFLLASFAWIFFRSQNLQEAFMVIKRIISPNTPHIIDGEFEQRSVLVYSLAGIMTVMITDVMAEFFPRKQTILQNRRDWVRLAAPVGLILIIILFGVFDGGQFIYFQF
jgi:alginate O-acetyltransferase complex protein AlgI